MKNCKFILPVCLFLAGSLWGQSNNPYSSFGLGERGGLDHGIYSGMGNNTINYISGSQLNINNPASYSFITRQLPLFSLGVSSRISKYSDGSSTESNALTGIKEMAFGVSFAKYFGLAFGLTPYYRKGYQFIDKNSIGTDTIVYEYKGSGSINRAFLGLSSYLLKYDSLEWTIGANLSGLFGNVKNERRSFLSTTTSTGGIGIESIQVRSFHWELGTYIRKKLPMGHELSLAAVYEPQQNISAVNNEQLFISNSDLNNPATYTLLTETGEAQGYETTPTTVKLGLNYTYKLKYSAKENKTRNSALNVLLGYSMSDWSNYSSTYRDTTINTGFMNTNAFNVGVQYTPETDLLTGKPVKFFERISYRIGFYNKLLPYSFNGTQYSEFGTTFGLGIPVLSQKTESSIQLGFIYGERGTAENESLDEQFIGINIGFIIAPSLADRWFIRRKLD